MRAATEILVRNQFTHPDLSKAGGIVSLLEEITRDRLDIVGSETYNYYIVPNPSVPRCDTILAASQRW